MTRRAAMFGAAMVAALATAALPVEASDTDGDGIPDTYEAVEKHAHAIAGSMAAMHGGEWDVSVSYDTVLIFKKLLVYTG